MQSTSLNYGVKSCAAALNSTIRNNLIMGMNQLKLVLKPDFRAELRLFYFSKTLLKRKMVKFILKFAKKYSGKSSIISKVKLFIAIIESVIRVRLFEYFSDVNQHSSGLFFKPDENLIDVKFGSEDSQEKSLQGCLNLSKQQDRLSIEDQTESFFKENGIPKKTLRINYNSETRKPRHDQFSNFRDTLKHVKGSIRSFEQIGDLDEELYPSFKDINETLNGLVGGRFPTYLQKVPNQKTAGLDFKDQFYATANPHTYQQDIDPKKGNLESNNFFGKNVPRNSTIILNKTKSKPETASRKSQLLKTIDQKIKALILKSRFRNDSLLSSVLLKFEQMQSIIFDSRDVNQQEFARINRVVNEISSLLKIKDQTVSSFKFDSNKEVHNSKPKNDSYNSRYKNKKSCSNLSKSIESNRSENSKHFFQRFRPKIRGDENIIQIEIAEVTSKSEKPKPFPETKISTFNPRAIERKATSFLLQKTNPLKSRLSKPKENYGLVGFIFYLNLLFQRKLKKYRRHFFSEFKETFLNAEKIAKTRIIFNLFLKKQKLKILDKLKFFQKRKNTILTEVLFQTTKAYKKVKKEIVWLLRDQSGKRFFKLDEFSKPRKSLKFNLEVDPKYFSVSPRHTSKLEMSQIIFSKSINNKIVDEIRQTEADCFFLELEKEYNQNFGGERHLFRKKN